MKHSSADQELRILLGTAEFWSTSAVLQSSVKLLVSRQQHGDEDTPGSVGFIGKEPVEDGASCPPSDLS